MSENYTGKDLNMVVPILDSHDNVTWSDESLQLSFLDFG